MNRLSYVYLSCLALLCMMLSACGGGVSGGGYANKTWDYNLESAPAEQQPGALPGPGISSPEAIAEEQAALPQVKVALLLPLSGQHKALGESMLNAAQIALFDIGHSSFELLPLDTKATSAGGQSAAQQAVQEGAELVLGPVFADAVRGAKPITSRANINMIAFSTDWQVAGGNTFLMGFMPFDQVDRVIEYASAHNIRNIAVISSGDEYGRVASAAFKTAAARYGIMAGVTEQYPSGSANLSPLVRRFTQYDSRTAQKPVPPPPYDAVFMPSGGQEALSIANLMSYYATPPSTARRLGTGLFDDRNLAAERSLEGAWFAAPSPRLREKFERRYRETYGIAAPRLTTLAYDATALAAVLAQRGLQSEGRPSFDRAAISSPNGFTGLDGIFRFRPNGTAERGLAILEYRNGMIAVRDPAPQTFQK